MLVLTRKREEKITIGKNPKIVITILKIQGDKVSIGIEADRDTPIYRNELLQGKDNSCLKDVPPGMTPEITIENLQIDLEKEKRSQLNPTST